MDFSFGGGYTPPDGDNVNFLFGEVAVINGIKIIYPYRKILSDIQEHEWFRYNFVTKTGPFNVYYTKTEVDAFNKTYNWKIISDDYTASNNDGLMLDSTYSGINIFLPSAPLIGNIIGFLDIASNCSNNPVTISGSGNKIMGSDNNYVINTDDANLALIYSNVTYGWRVY